MAVCTDNKAVLATCVVVAGLFIGINNTLITETVMKAAPVERGVASAAYSFLRFGGAAVAPWLAGVLGEHDQRARAVLGRRGRGAAGRGRAVRDPRSPGGHRRRRAELDELTDEATAVTVGSDS